jgi:hypothetical protein
VAASCVGLRRKDTISDRRSLTSVTSWMWVSLCSVPGPEIIYFFVPHYSYSISLLSSRFGRPVLSILLLLSCHYRPASVISLLPPILPCRFLACNLVVTFSIFSSIFITSFFICILVICTGSSRGVLRHSEERGCRV